MLLAAILYRERRCGATGNLAFTWRCEPTEAVACGGATAIRRGVATEAVKLGKFHWGGHFSRGSSGGISIKPSWRLLCQGKSTMLPQLPPNHYPQYSLGSAISPSASTTHLYYLEVDSTILAVRNHPSYSTIFIARHAITANGGHPDKEPP